MALHLDEVAAAIREGSGLVVVQEDDVQEYVRRFVKEDPAGVAPARPVLAWDPVAGFLACSEYLDELPAVVDPLQAMQFVSDYRGNAVFVFDCRETDMAAEAGVMLKPLRQLHLKLVDSRSVVMVLVVATAIPASLAQRLNWIGEEPAEATASGSRATAAPAKEKFRDVHSLDKFDTLPWQTRLEEMHPDEVQEIVESRAWEASLERLRELHKALEDRFARKSDVVGAICAAAIAHVPTVLIGPPGTAKSNIIRCFCEGLGLTSHGEASEGNGSTAGRSYFEYLLTRYTTPEEIFGPIHVQDLIDRQLYRRVTEGYLPEAQIAFLDEIFKASSAILNTLLTLLNERIFYNAGRAVKIPLLMVFAASNKAPTDEGLQALYDRFPLRLNCPSIEDEHVDNLLELSWQQAFDRQFHRAGMAVNRCACTNDLRLLRHVMRVRFGGRSTQGRAISGIDFSSEFLRFFRSLRADFGISDRTAALLLAFCRANALLNNRSEMTVDELDVFRHVSWDEAGTGELDRLVANMKRGVRI